MSNNDSSIFNFIYNNTKEIIILILGITTTILIVLHFKNRNKGCPTIIPRTI